MRCLPGTQHAARIPAGALRPSDIPVSVARSLPGRSLASAGCCLFRVEFASMFIAATELPTDELRERLRRYTTLDLRFHLVTPSNFEELVEALL